MKIVTALDLKTTQWPRGLHAVFWAERVSIRKSTGYSPYYMVHGVEPVLPFDVSEATYLLEAATAPLTTDELVLRRARQLLKREEDLEEMAERVLKSRQQSAERYAERLERTTIDYDFDPGSYVLIRNTRVEKELNRKSQPRYIGPMIVVGRRAGGTYVCCELDGSILKLAS